MNYRFTLRNGDVAEGEYVGAMDGYVYLATGEQVDRIEQSQVVKCEVDPT
jgi:hypothetical protein